MKKTSAAHDKLADCIRKELLELGEKPSRQGLLKTPARAAKALREITCGYDIDLDKLFNGAFFDTDSNDLVLIRDIQFHSLCEHHLLPFFGRVHIGYIPCGKIVGLSKMPRLVRAFASRLQVQERLTRQIADTLFETLNAAGVAVVVEARHMCMEMRGARSTNSTAVTSAMMGVFRKDIAARQEFMSLIRSGGKDI
ncbi:MAG: GTP cyclohydrolase I FolE [Elusimicrobia bacterium]|nr:GTP cyclohydrolase I FolE [Elusimicrobiota bacterium]